MYYHHVHNSSRLFPTLNSWIQPTLFHPISFEIYFNIILKFTPKSCKRPVYFKFPFQKLPYVCLFSTTPIWCQTICNALRICVWHCIRVSSFCGVEMLASQPTSKLEDHHFSAVCYSVFNIIAGTLHICMPFAPSAAQRRACRRDAFHLSWKGHIHTLQGRDEKEMQYKFPVYQQTIFPEKTITY